MDTTKLTQHIQKTLSHTLGMHQYGIVDDAKNMSIVKTMANYLQGLHDMQAIVDFSLSVVNVSDDQISASIAITQMKGSEPFLVKSGLRTRNAPTPPVEKDDAFDRAMSGV